MMSANHIKTDIKNSTPEVLLRFCNISNLTVCILKPITTQAYKGFHWRSMRYDLVQYMWLFTICYMHRIWFYSPLIHKIIWHLSIFLIISCEFYIDGIETDIHGELNLLTIQNRHDFNMVWQYHKYINFDVKSIAFHKLYISVIIITGCKSSEADNKLMKVANLKSGYGRNVYSIREVWLWNKLPADITSMFNNLEFTTTLSNGNTFLFDRKMLLMIARNKVLNKFWFW